MPFNDSIYSMTPGSAVSDTIQAILQRRRDEQRQAMLDKLSEEDTRSQMAARAEESRLAGRADIRATEGQLEDILRQRAETIPGGADLSAVDPGLADYVRKTGRGIKNPAVTPTVTTSTSIMPPQGASPEDLETFAQAQEQITSTGPQTPANETFAGSEEFQAARRAESELDKLLTNPEISQNPDLMQALLISRAGGMNQGTAQFLGEPPRLRHVGPTGNMRDLGEIGRNDKVVESGFPPQQPAWGAPKVYQEIDRSTQRVIRTHVLNPDQAAVLAEDLAQRGAVLVPTTSPFGAGSTQERSKDLAAREFARAFTSNAPRAQRAAELNQSRVNLIAATIVSNPAMKEELSRISERILVAVEANGTVPSDSAVRLVEAVRSKFPDMAEADVAEVTETINMLLTNVPKR